MRSAQQRIAWVLFGLLTVASAVMLVAPGDDATGGRLTTGSGAAAEDADGGGDQAAASGESTDDGTEGGTGDTAAADGGNDDGQDEGDEGRGTSFTIAAVGDVLVHESVAESARTGDIDFDFTSMFDLVTPTLGGADLALCHLETPVSSTNTDLAYYPAFRVPHEIVDAVAAAGFDGCSFASNHTLDAGPEGVIGTLDAMEAAGVAVAGSARSQAEADAPLLYDVGGVSVGHLSTTYGLNPGYEVPADQPWLVEFNDADTILADAAALTAAGADFVVLSIQWGIEYQTEPTDEQRSLAATLLASPDIDLIVGHHAHVLQPVERIGDEYVAYGLGNFLSNQSPESCSVCPAGTQDGVVVRFTVDDDGTGRHVVTDVSAVPTWVDRTDYTIVPVADPSAPLDPAVAQASLDRSAAALGDLVPLVGS